MPVWYQRGVALLLFGAGAGIGSLPAQVLTLDASRTRALETSPVLRAAREAVAAGVGRERQCGGARGARREAAGYRREAAADPPAFSHKVRFRRVGADGSIAMLRHRHPVAQFTRESGPIVPNRFREEVSCQSAPVSTGVGT